MGVWPGSNCWDSSPSLPPFTRASWLGRGIGHHQGTLAENPRGKGENWPEKCYPALEKKGEKTSNKSQQFWGLFVGWNPESCFLKMIRFGVFHQIPSVRVPLMAMRQWGKELQGSLSMTWFKGQEQSPKYGPPGLAAVSPCQLGQFSSKKHMLPCPYFRAVSCWERRGNHTFFCRW